MLALEDLYDCDHNQVLAHICASFEVEMSELDGIVILVAYESVGSWGCDSNNWFLFRKGGQLYENHGGHCSCNGFEGQWGPEETNLAYLKSDKFEFWCGGYDGDTEGNKAKVYECLEQLYPDHLNNRRAAVLASRG